MSSENTETTDSTRSITDRLEPYYGENLGKAFAFRAFTFTIFLALLYVWRPLIHGQVYAMRYSPDGLITGVLSALALVALWFAPRAQDLPVHSEWKPRNRQRQRHEQTPGLLDNLLSIGVKAGVFVGTWVLLVSVYSVFAGLIAWALAAMFIIAAFAAPIVAYLARGETGININSDILPGVNAGASRTAGGIFAGHRYTCSLGRTVPLSRSNRCTDGCATQPLLLSSP